PPSHPLLHSHRARARLHRCSHLYATQRALPSFPTRRSSDLSSSLPSGRTRIREGATCLQAITRCRSTSTAFVSRRTRPTRSTPRDRKSTRLNSSHQIISYAVFCLKKKTKHSRHSPTHSIYDS